VQWIERRRRDKVDELTRYLDVGMSIFICFVLEFGIWARVALDWSRTQVMVRIAVANMGALLHG